MNIPFSAEGAVARSHRSGLGPDGKKLKEQDDG
jgi:hypothetical protein